MSLPKRSRWRMLLMLLTLLPPLLLTAACTPPEEEGEETAPEETSAADEEAVRQIADDFAAAYNAGDAAGVAQLYTEDAVRFGAVLLEGRAAVEEQIAADLAQGEPKIEFSDLGDVHVAGDRAYSTGQYTFTVTTPDGETVSTPGKFLTVAARQADGSWKIKVNSFNANVPPPGAEQAGEEGGA